jgi:hypothetical protein
MTRTPTMGELFATLPYTAFILVWTGNDREARAFVDPAVALTYVLSLPSRNEKPELETVYVRDNRSDVLYMVHGEELDSEGYPEEVTSYEWFAEDAIALYSRLKDASIKKILVVR